MNSSNYQPFWFSEAIKQEANSCVSPLINDTHTDVCIVGGGYTGLWTALQLKLEEPELDILVIDKGLCGSGASGRNGGCMLTWSSKYLSMKRLYGKREANRLVRASEDAIYNIRDFCLEHQIDAQVRIDGALYTATNQSQVGNMGPVIKELIQENCNSWQHWSPARVQKASGSHCNIDGYFSPVANRLVSKYIHTKIVTII